MNASIPALPIPRRAPLRTDRTRVLAAGAALLVALACALPRPALAVDVTFTADNAYVFGYGPASGPTSLYGGIENCVAADIFSCGPGPETYLGVPGVAGDYLYVVTWSDGGVTQEALGQFVDGSSILRTGQPGWQVFASGQDLDPDCGPGSSVPSLAAIVAQVTVANAAAGGVNSSVGWVGPTGGASGTVGALAVGEANDSASGEFPIVCNITNNARWMWYNPDPGTITNPFRIGSAPMLPNDNSEFLIFRLPAEIATPSLHRTWGGVKTFYR